MTSNFATTSYKASTYNATIANSNQTAVDCLADASGLSKQKIKDAMQKGAVWVIQNKKQLRLRRASKTFNPGTQLILHYDAKVLELSPAEPTCLLNKRDYSIWYKPSGLHSQGTQWGDHCSLLRWVELQNKNAFLIHRLDADASGIVLVGHTGKAAAQLSALFQTRDIEKYYEAWVDGACVIPAEGLIINNPIEGKPAETWVTESLGSNGKTKLLIDLKSGRKHQIRRHLATALHPIIGDRLYGKSAKLPLQLCAYKLSFTCPFTQEKIEITLDDSLRLSQVAPI